MCSADSLRLGVSAVNLLFDAQAAGGTPALQSKHIIRRHYPFQNGVAFVADVANAG